MACFGDELVLTLGAGPDHGLCEVYLNHGFWQAFDGYAAQAGEREITIELEGEGPHVLEVRSTGHKSLASSSWWPTALVDLHTIQYQYDALSRLLGADYFPGMIISSPASICSTTSILRPCAAMFSKHSIEVRIITSSRRRSRMPTSASCKIFDGHIT